MTFIDRTSFSNRCVAVVLGLSLLLSAFPASFFSFQFAQAATATVEATVLPEPSNTNSEYITFENTSGADSVDLSGLKLYEAAGELYEFPASTILAPGGTYTICKASGDAASDYGVSCDGTFSGGLNNDGSETLAFYENDGTTVIDGPEAVGDPGSDTTATVSFSLAAVVAACTPQFDVAGPTNIQNTVTNDYFTSINDALADCDTSDNDVIALLGNITTSEQQTITRPITIEGNGNTLNAEFYKTSNSNNAAIGVQSDDVTIQNLVVDGTDGLALQMGLDLSTVPTSVALALDGSSGGVLEENDRWRLGLHGINVFTSDDVVVDTVTAISFRSGLLVNGSTVDAEDFSSVDNYWHGINVDQGSGVTQSAVLNISNTSSHNENSPTPPSTFVAGQNVPHIFIDNVEADATVNDDDSQYDVAEVDFRGARALVYTLKQPEPEKISPSFQCWVDNGDQTATGYFGYNNPNDFIVNIPVGDENKVNGPLAPDAGQPTEFLPGKTPFVDDGGVFKPENAAFSVTYPLSGNISWTLNGRVGTAGTPDSQKCPTPEVAEVTMCKYDALGTPLPGWQLALLGEEVQTLAKNPTADVQTMSGVPMGEYVLKAEGTYNYGNGNRFADARFSERKPGDTGYASSPFTPWREALAPNEGLAVQVNGDSTLWGSVYNPAHVYYGSLTQAVANDPIDFYIYDNVYTDNVGTIDLTLFTGQTGVTGDNGCVTFSDVPYGEYQVEELLQDGWTNLSGLETVVVDEDIETFDVVNRDPNEPTVDISATKIVCNDESELPDWGDGTTNIDANTAATWLSDNTDTSCRVVPDWEFEWGTESAQWQAGDFIGSALGEWTTFVGTTSVPGSVFAGTNLKLREVQQPGYLAFAGGKNDESAEFYCHTDGLNYDNGERINKPKADTTYHCVAWNVDLDPEVEMCTLDIVSDTGTVVVENRDYAVPTYDENPRWTASIPGATWIWEAFNVADPETDTTLTFQETFTVTSVADATLYLAADNSYSVTINGTPVATESNGNNYQTATQDEYDVTSYLDDGTNTMEITVTNNGTDGSSPESNPAGALYRLLVNAEADCERTTFVDTTPLTCDYGVNLLANPSFEADVVTAAREWDLFDTLTGWTVEKAGGGIAKAELQAGVNDWASADGNQHAELGSNQETQLGQTIPTIIGEEYTLSWQYSPRPERDKPESRMRVYVDGLEVATNNEHGADDVAWTEHSVTFTATKAYTEIFFVDEGKNNSFGPFLDDTSLRCGTAPVVSDTIDITGFKYNASTSAGLPDWEIVATNEFLNEVATTSTESDGSYSFLNLPDEGEWVISEVLEADWEQEAVAQNGKMIDADSCRFGAGQLDESFNVSFAFTAQLRDDDEYEQMYENRCDFYNRMIEDEPTDPGDPTETTEDDNDGGDGPGAFFGNSFNAPADAQAVLGASTANICPFLIDHMQIGWDNDKWEVIKLQLFLRLVMQYDNPVTGEFGTITDENVKRFQAAFADEILTPWFEADIVPHNDPTGFVYKTTKWKINDIVCPGDPFPSLEGENLLENVDID